MIIDTRMRPMYGAFAEQFTPEACAPFCRKIGMDMPESVRTASEKAMLEEMDAAGVSVGIAPSRFIPNDHLVEMVEHFKGRFVGMASIDSANTIKENLDIIKRYAVDGPLTGIHFEPGHSAVPLYANDPKFYPVYEYCQEQGLVVGIMLGGNSGPNLINWTNPAIITQLAADFPSVNWFICHGGWPWVTEILGTWFWYENSWIEPDLYMFNCPGAQEYINAANGFLQDRFMFGSGYPLLPLGETVRRSRKLFSDAVYDKVMFKNAATLFNLAI